MKRLIVIAMLSGLPLGALAEEGDIDRGMSLLEEGTRLILEGLLAEIGPEIEELLGTIEGLRGYHAPELLPNGDIIIRRRQPGDAPPEPDSETGEVEL